MRDERFLDGQVAVVTGAGRGIGRDTALELAKAGARLVVAARTVREIEETAANVRSLGQPCLVVPTDVTDEAACEDLIARAIGEYGRLDILINNAGAAIFKPVWELTADDLDFNLNVNLRGTFFCARAAVRHMMAQKSGVIVNVASSSGKKPYVGQAGYCASKAGVVLLSKVMALELRPYGVRVHAVCPGIVDTQMAAQIHPERSDEGWIKPEDIAATILYLLALPANVSVDEVVIRRFQADPM